MLGQFDQQPLYNAMNFSRSIYSAANSTVYTRPDCRRYGAPATVRSLASGNYPGSRGGLRYCRTWSMLHQLCRLRRDVVP